MTIASEITRLQNDKAAMCAAIEAKWVTVGGANFDDYAACIAAIPQGMIGVKKFDYIVVWGGGGWGNWWGWWGAVCVWEIFTGCDTFCATIGNWWGNNAGWGASSLWTIQANGWWAGGTPWGTSGSWCWGGGNMSWAYWGGWGASWNWCGPTSWHWGAWWTWICWYWWGGWWGASWTWWAGTDGWWNGASWTWQNGFPAVNCWWGWGGKYFSSRTGGAGAPWLVVVCYKTDWSYWFSVATWGNCCYECNWYCIHCFTSNWTFCIIS